MTLKTTLEEEAMNLQLALLQLFNSQDIVKIGFGMDNDIKMLLKSYPCLGCLEHRQRHCVDLMQMAGEVFLGPEQMWRKGLSSLVRQVFGQDLDKSQQCSAWSDRP